MRQVFKKIPVYTGDVSGVCSALFELGGMVVMHDPSGCNSTYNTHDEIRWYDQDSLIFISGLNEMEAIMGSDDALIRDITESARIYSPEFIAIANSPIPYITGMDFDAISRLVEDETGIPTFYITTNGMHDYSRGAGLAFLHLAERFVEDPVRTKANEDASENRPLRCNILGMTPLDFAASASVVSLRGKIENAGMEILSCWAMGDSLEQIQNSASADVNLVIASSGLPAARYMYSTFGIPYVVGIPAEGVEDIYFQSVRTAAQSGENQYPFRDRAWGPNDSAPVCFIGEPVIMASLAASVERRTGAKTCVFGSTEDAGAFLGASDQALCGEEELEEALRNVVDCRQDEAGKNNTQDGAGKNNMQDQAGKGKSLNVNDTCAASVKVVADPYYRDVLPDGCKLSPLPHLAFSGRILLKDIPDLFRFMVD